MTDSLEWVTVHSVHSNTLRDAQNLCIRKKLPVAGSVGDLRSHKTPRGILPVNSNWNETDCGYERYKLL